MQKSKPQLTLHTLDKKLTKNGSYIKLLVENTEIFVTLDEVIPKHDT